METFLAKQTALVTGASSGIGASCAIELARRGANVTVNYLHNRESTEKIVHECLQFGVKACAIQADVSDQAQVKRMFDETLDTFGRLDILVANAGIQRDANILEMTLEDWQKVIAVNLSSQFLCAQRAAQIFVAQGVQNDISLSAGKILHMSSVHDKIPWPGHCNYAASKGGIKMLMQTLALELAPHKIRVNSLSPGAIKTRINKEVWSNPDAKEDLMEIIPYQRLGQSVEVASVAAWLCSDYCDYVTGATQYIDGGMTLYPSFSENG